MRTLRTIAVSLALAASSGAPNAASAQQSLAYQARSNRYEGLKSDFNAKPKYEVRGIFGREDLASAAANSDLKISFYIPPDGTILNIQAQELQKNKNYLMIPKLPLPDAIAGEWTTFSPWPVSEVLAKVNILPTQLGVVVSLKLSNVPNLYAPALLYTDHVQPYINAYSIFFSSDKPVAHVRCTLIDATGSNRSASGVPYKCSLPNRETSLPGNVTTRFEISAASLLPGLVTVTILGEYANDESGESLHAVVHFYHEPRVNIR